MSTDSNLTAPFKTKNLIYLIFLAGLTALGIIVGFMGNYLKLPAITQPIIAPESPIRLDFQTLELAKTNTQHQLGYQGRTDICQDCGMLFVFPDQRIRSFWMKNTPTSLDIIFLDSQGKILNIYPQTKPFQESPGYESTSPAQYVLEVPAGYSQRFNLQTNQTLDIPHLLNQAQGFNTPPPNQSNINLQTRE